MVQCHIAQSVKFVIQCRQYGSALMGEGIVCRHFFTDLHSRGYNSLTIRENGDIAIQQADSEKVRTAFESVPEKPYWARLCKVFEREGMAANITDGGILLSW